MFDIVGEKIQLSADGLAIPPFKEHYESAKDKSQALKEIEYIFWLYKWNTIYLAYPPEIRPGKVANDVFKIEDYEEPENVKNLAIRFNEFQNTPLIRLYRATEEGVEYLIDTLNNLKNDKELGDLDIETRLKVAQAIAKILKDVEPSAKSLESAKQRAMAEQVESGKIKGGGKIGRYEIPRK